MKITLITLILFSINIKAQVGPGLPIKASDIDNKVDKCETGDISVKNGRLCLRKGIGLHDGTDARKACQIDNMRLCSYAELLQACNAFGNNTLSGDPLDGVDSDTVITADTPSDDVHKRVWWKRADCSTGNIDTSAISVFQMTSSSLGQVRYICCY